MTRVPERPLPFFGAFRSLRRNPCRTVLRKVPPVPEASPEVISPKAPFDMLSNQTLRNAFGTRHVSRRLSRKSPSKNALFPRSLAESLPGSLLRNVLGTCHVFPSAEWKIFPPGFFPSRHVSPNAPSGKSLRKPPELATHSECLTYTSRKPRVRRETSECDSPEAFESATCLAKHISPGTRRLRRVSRVSPSRRPLGYHRQPHESPRKTLPGTLRVRRVSIIPGTTFLLL